MFIWIFPVPILPYLMPMSSITRLLRSWLPSRNRMRSAPPRPRAGGERKSLNAVPFVDQATTFMITPKVLVVGLLGILLTKSEKFIKLRNAKIR